MSEKVNAYAKALVLIGRADNRLADVEDELFQFATILKSNDQLRNTLNDKNIAIEERIAVINVVLEGKALNTTKGIISLFVASENTGLIDEITDAFVKEAANTRSKEVATIRTATELDDATIEKLAAALSKRTGKEIDVKVIIDETVIGGIIAKVGDEVIDGSIKTRLAKLKETIDG